ncbi:MAG: hypothetical protein JNM74_22025 [Myxococcales bacterium]|nr:hypothetical protein [Myxococcales bacterium]
MSLRSVSLRSLSAVAFVGLLAFSTGCAPSLAAPFDQMKNAPITVYRLQNYEPPAQAAATPGAAVPGLPPQLQQGITAGASLLPPGLIPPGLIPGGAATPAPGQEQVQRFHNFRILGYSALNDKAQREEALAIFGTKSNFTNAATNCLYAEFGFSFGSATGGPPADVMVSLSCNQVKGENFAWPHPGTGLTADTSKRIIAIAQKVFGG